MKVAPVTYTMDESVTMPVEERPGMSRRNIAHIVYRRKWLVLLVFLCLAPVTSALILHTIGKPVFMANSQILVSPGREQVIDPAAQTGGAVAPWQGFNAVEQTAWVREILTGRFLAERVVKAIGPNVLYPVPAKAQWDLRDTLHSLMETEEVVDAVDEKLVLEETVNAFLKNVSADPVGRSSIINLSFTHENPELAARVVNMLGELYLERHLGVQRNPKSDAFFKEQFGVLKQKLAESEDALLAFKQRHGITSSVKQEQELVLEQQSDLRRELTEARSRQAEVQSRDAELRQQLGNTSRSSAVVKQLREKLTALEIQESELALRFTAQNPALRGIRDEIQKLRGRINQMEGASLYGAEAGQDSLYATLQAQLLSSVAEGKALRAREDTLSAKVADLQARLNTLEQVETDFNQLEKQQQIDENNYRLYLTKFEESRISGAMDEEKIASVRVIEQANVPLKPMRSKRLQKVLLGIVACAVAALGLPFVLQFLAGSLDTAEDVERALELPVLASIPRLGLK